MRFGKPRPAVCGISHCDRVATMAVSSLPDTSTSCGFHLVTFEKRWGQVFIRGIK